ncbi:Mor transcription activator family protein [Accumulibacter sp.]|uniref:Mor transcription activator family protein n=1 Tax=Accumulibacter sp. TaxID=2053492 RepID=UPI00260755B6|nr:Mor transcription activator family protein [Accumulibacter sp.]
MTEPPPDADASATDNLPASVRELIALIGLAPTLALVNVWGGQILHVPTGDNPNSKARRRLVAVIGDSATEALIWNYPGAKLTIARCVAAMRDERDRRIIAAYGAGTPVAQLVADHQLTDRRIRTIIKRSPGDSVAGLAPGQARQLALFEA